ncbi:arylesterase [Rhodoligotrophos defluvii]|uniref:arylesterase n=1 Tax=Rhodoligotrophos defluvii TaxID=2561934 RepID=UPI001EF05EE4|nr:arylesterase [Rhodoligotrophos defluvii]
MRQIKTVLLLMLALMVSAASVGVPGPARAQTAPLKLVVLGDSLSAGYRLGAGEDFPSQLEAALKQRGHNVTVVNAGVSGDTASGGLSRLDWAVPEDADAVIVELGANDALRGVDPAVTEKALNAILQRLGERGIPVLLAGMIAPPNMGKDYGEAFNPIYSRLAQQHDALLYPFFLEGVATDAALNLDDGMHPNAKGIAAIVERITPLVEQLLERAEAARAG